METLYSIKKRRSVRKFTEGAVDRELIKEIVEVARFYPSWKNSQTARFYIVDQLEKKMELAQKATFSGGNNRAIIEGAPAVLVLAMKKGLSGTHPDGVYVTDKKDTWEMFDSGLAAQTFSLVAFEKGIGSVILGIFDENKVAEICGIPADEQVAALIPIGYPVDMTHRDGVRKSVDEILTFI